MDRSLSNPARIAILGEFGRILFYEAMLKRNYDVVSTIIYKPATFADDILPLSDLNPDLILIVRFSNLDTAEKIAQQILSVIPDVPIVASIAAFSDRSSPYIKDYICMPIIPKTFPEFIQRVLDNTP